MALNYTKQSWNNNDPNTPLNATRVNHLESGVKEVSDAVDDLSTVAETGAYSDLSGKPTIPSTPSDIGAAAASHTHPISQINNSTEVGQLLVTAANAGAARTAVGLGNVDNIADASKNVLSATKLSTARSIQLLGTVSGTVSFDGSENVTINTTANEINQTHVTGATTPFWKTSYTSQDFSTSTLNTAEHYVSKKAGVNTETPNLAGWVNEWGAIRGTSPYGAWGDSLVRAIRSDGDAITAVDAAAIEVTDRRTGATSTTMWGRSWVDGGIIRNSQPVIETYTWRGGDPDPTVGGTVSLPARAEWIIKLGTDQEVPSWVPAGSMIVRR